MPVGKSRTLPPRACERVTATLSGSRSFAAPTVTLQPTQGRLCPWCWATNSFPCRK
jgi:hypothetical protein